jgi:hypothetical protein
MITSFRYFRSVAFFPGCKGRQAYKITLICLCGYSHLKLLKQLIDFHETLTQYFVISGYLKAAFSYLLRPVITTWPRREIKKGSDVRATGLRVLKIILEKCERFVEVILPSNVK